MFFKLLGRVTWTVLKVIAPPLARRAQKRLVGGDHSHRGSDHR